MIKNLEKYIREYRGIPFKYGGLDKGGFDCIGFVYRFYCDQGVIMPDHCEDANEGNYSEIYRGNDDRADELLLKYFDSFGTEVNPFDVMAGDAIIVRHDRTKHLFPAIYGGNGIAITSFLNREVRTFSLTTKTPVIKARRVI